LRVGSVAGTSEEPGLGEGAAESTAHVEESGAVPCKLSLLCCSCFYCRYSGDSPRVCVSKLWQTQHEGRATSGEDGNKGN